MCIWAAGRVHLLNKTGKQRLNFNAEFIYYSRLVMSNIFDDTR
jgi:hypothetical protein